jgi:hypothetical protein
VLGANVAQHQRQHGRRQGQLRRVQGKRRRCHRLRGGGPGGGGGGGAPRALSSLSLSLTHTPSGAMCNQSTLVSAGDRNSRTPPGEQAQGRNGWAQAHHFLLLAAELVVGPWSGVAHDPYWHHMLL